MICVYLPWPPVGLFPNRNKGMHWARKKNLADQYKHDCFYSILLQKLAKEKFADGKIPVSIIFNPPNKRRFDLDNCLSAAKNGLDRLAQSIDVDDSRFRPMTIDIGEVIKGGRICVRVG